ncbi:stationary phase survival protein SurE [Pedobacter sp. ASV12]|uniref:stationary phase survival protein SurE n=1 Tax=Pedobacter sp. ASV12 TaxID=2795120 RepID=UPI0018ED1EBD|nr:stationary phase survival protein SurE [Pedobacter sp. ASV12]
MQEKIKAIKNNVWMGMAVGLLAPLVPGFLVWYLMQHVKALQHADLLLIGCVAINAFLMNYFFKINKEHVGRGILSITFLWAFAFFFYKVL